MKPKGEAKVWLLGSEAKDFSPKSAKISMDMVEINGSRFR